ncbi:MAG: NAD(P)/FAD-dependent oxidoreductase [Pseudomonadota bacterium]
MTERYDTIIVGAGHNGLACAALLAKAGQDVLVLEAADHVGGAAVTREFADGFQVSGCAHLVTQLQPAVMRELKLNPSYARQRLATIALAEDGRHLKVEGDTVSGVSDDEAMAYLAFSERMQRFADLLNRQFLKTPPRLGSGERGDLLALAKLGFDIRRLGKRDMQDLLRLIGMNIHDEVQEHFDHPLLKGAISLDAVMGTHLGPRSPNTILTYLYRLAGGRGNARIPAGGMGPIAGQFAKAARDAGATIQLGAAVSRIVVDNGRVVGVETADGACYESYRVVSNADPKRTVLELVGARHVEAGFAQRIKRLRAEGNAAKLHLALDGLPTVAGLGDDDFGERLLIAPDEHYVERAFNPAKYGEYSPEPVFEITFPSVHDVSLAPAGQHVMSAVLQYAPYALKEGWDYASRSALLDTAMATLARFLPGLEQRVIASELLTPADIEREYRITGGHWHHTELTLDQFLFVRPISGAAQYAMPLDGLWLCGAGTHPGGGVSGAAGRNAARQILSRAKSK